MMTESLISISSKPRKRTEDKEFTNIAKKYRKMSQTSRGLIQKMTMRLSINNTFSDVASKSSPNSPPNSALLRTKANLMKQQNKTSLH